MWVLISLAGACHKANSEQLTQSGGGSLGSQVHEREAPPVFIDADPLFCSLAPALAGR